LGHADKSRCDLYDKIKEDLAFRKEWAEKCGFGFKLPSVIPNVPKIEEKTLTALAAYVVASNIDRMVGERGFEPPTPFSRTGSKHYWKLVENDGFQLLLIEWLADRTLVSVDLCGYWVL
jgi:hypothetical protein